MPEQITGQGNAQEGPAQVGDNVSIAGDTIENVTTVTAPADAKDSKEMLSKFTSSPWFWIVLIGIGLVLYWYLNKPKPASAA